MTKAAIYARPFAPGETPDAQLSKLRKVAEQRELSVFADYFDKADASHMKRPGLARLLRDAQNRRFDVLLVDSFYRIAWSVPHLHKLMGELGKIGIRVISIRDHFDSGASLSGQTVLTASILHNLEKRLTSERLESNRQWFRETAKSQNQNNRYSADLDDIEDFPP